MGPISHAVHGWRTVRCPGVSGPVLYDVWRLSDVCMCACECVEVLVQRSITPVVHINRYKSWAVHVSVVSLATRNKAPTDF